MFTRIIFRHLFFKGPRCLEILLESNSNFRRTDTLNLDEESGSKADVRNQRNKPSLESLKETILELKKSLNESEKKQRENPKSAKEEEQKEPRDKHRKDVNEEVESTRKLVSIWRTPA